MRFRVSLAALVASLSFSGCALTPESMEAINNSLNAINNQYAPQPADPYVPNKLRDDDTRKCVSGKRYTSGKDAGKCTDHR